MSSMRYPLWWPGSKRLRVFLPDFFMKLVKLDRKLPPNHLTFIVDMRMSQYDVRNYLRAIYGMTAKDVRLRECLGKEKTNPLYGSKLRLDDYKVAHVVMEKDFVFEWPDLFGAEDSMTKDLKQYDDMKNEMRAKKIQYWDRPGIPTWWTPPNHETT